MGRLNLLLAIGIALVLLGAGMVFYGATAGFTVLLAGWFIGGAALLLKLRAMFRREHGRDEDPPGGRRSL